MTKSVIGTGKKRARYWDKDGDGYWDKDDEVLG